MNSSCSSYAGSFIDDGGWRLSQNLVLWSGLPSAELFGWSHLTLGLQWPSCLSTWSLTDEYPGGEGRALGRSLGQLRPSLQMAIVGCRSCRPPRPPRVPFRRPQQQQQEQQASRVPTGWRCAVRRPYRAQAAVCCGCCGIGSGVPCCTRAG